jgi:hypothetical protein
METYTGIDGERGNTSYLSPAEVPRYWSKDPSKPVILEHRGEHNLVWWALFFNAHRFPVGILGSPVLFRVSLKGLDLKYDLSKLEVVYVGPNYGHGLSKLPELPYPGFTVYGKNPKNGYLVPIDVEAYYRVSPAVYVADELL